MKQRDDATKPFEVAPQDWRDLVVLVAGSPWNGLQISRPITLPGL